MEPEYTSKGMPIISQDTIDTLFDRYTGERSRDWGQYITGVQQRVVTEDPVLTKFLEKQVGGKIPEELQAPVFEVLIGLYAVLENQTEVNRLNRELGT